MKKYIGPMSPNDVFMKQIDCIKNDDRETQLQLYAENCIYEFPFATDRPTKIVGRNEIRKVMEPMWKEASSFGVKVIDCNSQVHQTVNPEVIVAEFTLSVEIKNSITKIPFVQVLRVKNNLITEIREYFSPVLRKKIVTNK